VSFAMGGMGSICFFLSLIRELTNGSIRRPTVGNCLVTLQTDKSVTKSPMCYYRQISPSSDVSCVITVGNIRKYFSRSRSVAKS